MIARQIKDTTGRRSRRILAALALGCCVTLSGLKPLNAFVRSEEELLKAEVTEAKARAKDFQAYKRRVAKEEIQRDQGVEEIKAARDKYDDKMEVARQKYIDARKNRKTPPPLDEKLEREDEVRRLKAEEAMDLARREYLKKREHVQETIDREAHIDPAEEYDLKPLPVGKSTSSSGTHSSPSGASDEPGGFSSSEEF